ncbi:MAG TPA: hypothetical protein VHC22_02690 [Pirellulales bacterium]|nr:hypothetical protein [Pirellulales bacterium]
MHIKTIPLSRLEANLAQLLTECADTGDPVVIELPDQRLLAIHSLNQQEDDNLIDELLASNSQFKALVEQSKASPRSPVPAS